MNVTVPVDTVTLFFIQKSYCLKIYTYNLKRINMVWGWERNKLNDNNNKVVPN